MSDSKARILARRSAFIAAAALSASCDRCTNTPSVCLSVSIVDSGIEDVDRIRPVVCLSMPRPCLDMIPEDFDATPADAGKEGGAITLKTIDINIDASAPPPPMPCLSVALPSPTPSPTPHVCLRRMR